MVSTTGPVGAGTSSPGSSVAGSRSSPRPRAGRRPRSSRRRAPVSRPSRARAAAPAERPPDRGAGGAGESGREVVHGPMIGRLPARSRTCGLKNSSNSAPRRPRRDDLLPCALRPRRATPTPSPARRRRPRRGRGAPLARGAGRPGRRPRRSCRGRAPRRVRGRRRSCAGVPRLLSAAAQVGARRLAATTTALERSPAGTGLHRLDEVADSTARAIAPGWPGPPPTRRPVADAAAPAGQTRSVAVWRRPADGPVSREGLGAVAAEWLRGALGTDSAWFQQPGGGSAPVAAWAELGAEPATTGAPPPPTPRSTTTAAAARDGRPRRRDRAGGRRTRPGPPGDLVEGTAGLDGGRPATAAPGRRRPGPRARRRHRPLRGRSAPRTSTPARPRR